MGDAQTTFDPSPDDPRIVAVLAARAKVDAAMRQHDNKTTLSLVARDLVVNAPINRVVDFDSFKGRLESSQIDYSTFESRFEFVGVRGEDVVLMGEEIVTPDMKAPHAGQKVRRRFTDVWKKISGDWKLVVRHANIVAVE